MASTGVRLGFGTSLWVYLTKPASSGCLSRQFTQYIVSRTFANDFTAASLPLCRCHRAEVAGISSCWPLSCLTGRVIRGDGHVATHEKAETDGRLQRFLASGTQRSPSAVLSETRQDDKHESDEYVLNDDRQRIYPVMALLFASLFIPKADDEVEDEVTLLIKMARLAHHKGDLKKADEHYHRALAAVVQRGRDKVWESQRVVEARVYIYDSMANLALSAMQLEKAESLFKETMRGLLQLGRKQTDNAIVELSLKLAMIYGMTNRNADAETGYKFCIDVMEKKQDEILPSADLFVESKEENENILALLGMCLNSYGRFLLNQHRLKPAEETLRKAIEVAEQVYDETNNHQVAVLYNDLATVQASLGQNEAALESVKKAVAIGEKLKSEDLPTYICNNGAICAEIGDLEEGTQMCVKALRMAQKNGDRDTVEEAHRCLTLIKIYKKKKATQGFP